MPTKRERDVALLRRQIAKLESLRNGAIACLVHCENTLPLKRKQLERKVKYELLKLRDGQLPDPGVAQDPSPIPVAHVAEDRRPADDHVTVVQDKPSDKPLARQDDELEIPSYLRRSALQPEVAAAAHAVANKHNKPPTPEQEKLVEKEKRKVREEHKQARLTGKTRKAPLTGRAAEAFLRGR